jgi:hypothetical protein
MKGSEAQLVTDSTRSSHDVQAVVVVAGAPHVDNLSRTSEHFLRARRRSAAPSLAGAHVTCAGGLMQTLHTTTAAGSS